MQEVAETKALVKKEQELGEYGKASIELNTKAEIVAKFEAKVDLIKELERLADQTKTPLDNEVVKYIKGLVAAANAVAV